jgi:hypothetical protein
MANGLAEGHGIGRFYFKKKVYTMITIIITIIITGLWHKGNLKPFDLAFFLN